MSGPGSAAQTVREIIEAARYLVLATAGTAGRPWSSPVYFAHIGLTDFFWVSSPEATGAGLRLYQASADAHWILAKDGQPDHRVPVPLT
jgi:general stress protein 26